MTSKVGHCATAPEGERISARDTYRNSAKVGYRALAELDGRELGGNRDGRVDAADALFRSLCAWVDTNRDGISQPGEIQGLDEVGVVALEYTYQTTRITDSFGNQATSFLKAQIIGGPFIRKVRFESGGGNALVQ